MARRIILHVGAPKCGSTYLQRCLLQSRETLAAAGIAYPHPGTGHPGNGADIRDWDAGRLAALFAPGIHTAVISHEDLLNATKRGAPLVRLAGEAGITLEVLAFLRPFRDFIYGSYSQQMKQHFETWLAAGQAYDGQDFDAFCAAWAARYRPAGKLASWAGMAAPGRFTLAPHDALRPTVEAL
ncbi:hypothetical protein, partial [Roseovarius sp. SYSU LYC5161]|uniref:hypothetical protein n=1 Tax=Roseovarius halophilus (ex Wu et al. 2025) TaxID=3376060 RepID=UPI00399B4886